MFLSGAPSLSIFFWMVCDVVVCSHRQELDRSIVNVGAGAFSYSTHDTPTSPSRPRVVELVSVAEGAPRMYVQHKPPFVAAVDGEKAEVLTVYSYALLLVAADRVRRRHERGRLVAHVQRLDRRRLRVRPSGAYSEL